MQAIWYFVIWTWPFFLFGGIIFCILLVASIVLLLEAISRVTSKRDYKNKLSKALICILGDCVLAGIAVFSFFQFYAAA